MIVRWLLGVDEVLSVVVDSDLGRPRLGVPGGDGHGLDPVNGFSFLRGAHSGVNIRTDP